MEENTINNINSSFDVHVVLHDLKHYLPAQAPLKDFIHHNTLHAFQKNKFYKGIRSASEIFGYKVSLTLDEYRELYNKKHISHDVIEKTISEKKGTENIKEWTDKLIVGNYNANIPPRIGKLRANWKQQYKIDLDSLVHPILFRILCSYLDQGISIWSFPSGNKGFLDSVRELEKNSFTSFFKTKKVKELLLNNDCAIENLLKVLVGDESLYKQYLFDQQFAHQGWSGIVSSIEDQPESLIDTKIISTKELIILELLLEIDSLDFHFGNIWSPLSYRLTEKPIELFAEVEETELMEVLNLWQDAYEWTYYDDVLTGIKLENKDKAKHVSKSFQAMFCIDDRETSLRTYLEAQDHQCETYTTPGFFTVEFFFQPEHGKFYTKQCPAPVTPKFLIKEVGGKEKRQVDLHFTKHTHSLFGGWLISQTLGFWSAFRLLLSIFRPSLSPATSSSFSHMDKVSSLTIENKSINDIENGLQIGYTIDEMVQRVEALLNSIGLVKDFASLIYLVGHGSSSVNNPHYAAYNCGACCGRPGSVNARVFAYMANMPKVRELLSAKGINISIETQFLGGLHDTTRDEIIFYDENILSQNNFENHKNNLKTFKIALDLNAKERSRRFVSINTKQSPEKIHKEVIRRSVSLFEPRPELNHATNTLCIVGRRELTKNLFLDRRAFTNSFDYNVDPEGKFLFNILKAAEPVCGGINLEYYFSRVDNQKLGAGTKLPHNVMGLFGVANGIDGDLRPGLPSQMIEVHDPIRLLIIVEHFPKVVLETIQKNADTYEWFLNEWVHLIVLNPETHEYFRFKDGSFSPYESINQYIETVSDINNIIETHHDNLPVYLIS